MLYLRCSGNQPAILNSLGRYQLTCDLMDSVRRATNDDHLQTVMSVEMDVQTRVHVHAGFVLHIGKYVAQVMRAVIIQKVYHTDDFLASLADFLLNQMIADQIADRFRAILVSEPLDAFVEGLK